MVVEVRHDIPPTPLSEEARAAFDSPSAPAWCSQILHDPNIYPIATPSREPKASSEDSFIAETLATDAAISVWQTFYRVLRRPSILPAIGRPDDDETGPIAGEFLSLLALGRGSNGHANVAHGGLIATILDEIMGVAVVLHRSPGMSGYTALLNVTYKRPVPTPGVVLCRTWLESRSCGRKLWLRGTVEDGQGGVYAEAESLVIEVKKMVGEVKKRPVKL
jgi:thioesterase superfamily protein 4